MRRGEIVTNNIAPDMLASTFNEVPDHTTLGAEFGVGSSATPEQSTNLALLPVGTKLFVRQDQRLNDVGYDAVGMILGHNIDKVQVITLSPKYGGSWGVHNAYGEPVSEIPDALAALDRLFDPEREFGSIAVLSETTSSLLGVRTSPTIGLAGCNSHEQQRLEPTLTISQLLDNYAWRAVALLPNSRLVRRDDEGAIIHLMPGQKHSDQPSRELRDQRSMLDRIQRLTGDQSVLSGFAPVAVLRGIEAAVSGGAFTDPQRPISSVARVIKKSAESVIV